MERGVWVRVWNRERPLIEAHRPPTCCICAGLGRADGGFPQGCAGNVVRVKWWKWTAAGLLHPTEADFYN